MNALIKVKIEFNNNGNPVNVMNILKDYPCLSMYLHDFMKAKDGYISKAEIHNNNIQDCDICNTIFDWRMNNDGKEADKLYAKDPKGFKFTYTFLCYIDC